MFSAISVHRRVDLLVLSRGISLCSEVSRGGARGGEESGKDRLNNGSENDLSAAGHRESHPEYKDELEDIVECCHLLVLGMQDASRASIRNQ